MTEFKDLILEVRDNVAWLTLNRPDRLNALSDNLLAELGQALDVLQTTQHRLVVIRGAGRSFCAGYDISSDSDEIGYAAERGPVEDRDRLVGNIELYTRIWRHPQPVIAAIHGHCIAGGTQLATMCDLTVVTEGAKIQASPSLHIGGGYLSPLWSHLVGPKRAKLMSFDTGHRIDGKTAAEWGWASYAVADDEFTDEIERLVKSIARTPANALRLKKEAINRAIELEGLLTYARMGAETDALLHLTPEVKEIQRWITELGIKGAIEKFNAEGVPDLEGSE